MTTIVGAARLWRYPTGHSRKQLREEVAKVFGFLQRTATGGTTGTIVDSALTRYHDDYWNGANALIVDADNAAPETENSWVTDFASSTGTLTVLPALSAAPAAGDVYQLYQRVGVGQINDALAKVCTGAEAVHSLTVSTTTIDYDLTDVDGLNAPNQVLDVYVRDLGNDDVMPQRVNGWAIEDNAGVLTLRLPGMPASNDTLWISYLIGEDSLTQDDTRVNLPTGLVRARAAVYLIELLLSQQDARGLDHWGQQLRYWTEAREREQAKVQSRAQRVRRYAWDQDQVDPMARALDAIGLTPLYRDV